MRASLTVQHGRWVAGTCRRRRGWTVNPSTCFWSFLTISAVVAAAVGLEVGYRLFTANDWESAGTTT
jgi:hypothetical protein